MGEQTLSQEEQLEHIKRVKRITGHTPNWNKRHTPPQHSKDYNRAFARLQMKRLVKQARKQQLQAKRQSQ